MSITLPDALPTLAAGQVVTAADLNAMASVANFLGAKPICKAYDSAGGQSISTNSNSPTVVNWSGTRYDNSGMWSSANPGRLTIQVDGWYKVRYVIVFGGTTAVAINSFVAANGSTSNYLGGGGENITGAVNVGSGASGLWPFYLTAGTYLQLQCFAGASGVTTETVTGGSSMSLEWVSE